MELIELTVEELAERWEWLTWELAVDLRITEQFPKRGHISYVVSGLTMEFEQDVAFCNDVENNLVGNCSVLLMFLKRRLKTIYLHPIGNGKYRERLVFSDGVILIEIAC